MEFRILGPLEVVADSGPVPVGGRRERALLVRLLLDANQAVSAERLIEDLWTDEPPGGALGSLRVAISRLRKSLGEPDRIVTRGQGYALQVRDEECDADTFEALVTAAGRDADTDPERVSSELGRALALWRGAVLEDIADRPFAVPEVGRFEELRLAALERRAEAELACGRHAELVGELESLVDAHPLRERLWAALIVALYRSGRQAEALRAYQHLRDALADQLGLEPSPDLRQLEALVLAQSPQLDAPRRSSPSEEAPGPLPRPLARMLDHPMAGRVVELGGLDAARRDAMAAERKVIFVTGEAGIGKSRLVAEVAASAAAAGSAVLYGRADEDVSAPYKPFIEAFRPYFQSHGGELATGLGPDAVELARLWPELAASLGVAPVSSSSSLGDQDAERYRLFEAVDELVSAVSLRTPLVLVFDDLHCADKPSLLLLRHLARSGRRASLLLLGTYRDTDLSRADPLAETLADLHRERLLDERIVLRGLDRADLAELVGAWSGEDAPKSFIDALHAQTQGNPFFAEEVLAHLAETTDAMSWGDALEGPGIPQGVRDVVGRRLSRLSDNANDVLTAAAVVGSEFDLATLVVMRDGDAAAVLDAIEETESAGLVAHAQGAPGRYAFAHALVRETLYDELSTTRRVRLHWAVGRALEQRHAGDLEPLLPELAHHFSEGVLAGDVDTAVHYAEAAAGRAARLLAHEEAARFATLALQMLELSTPAEEHTAIRCRLLLALGEAQGRAGEATASRQSFMAAAAMARRTGDTRALARAALGVGGGLESHTRSGGIDAELVALLEEALEALGDGDDPLRVRLLGRLAVALYWTGEAAARRSELAQAAVDMAARLDDDASRAISLSSARYARWEPDNLSYRVEASAEILRLARAVGDRDRILQAHRWRVMDLLEQGEGEAADAEIDAHAALAEELRQPVYLAYNHLFRAMRLLMDGKFDAASEVGQEALAVAGAAQGSLIAALVQAQASNAMRETGRTRELAELIQAVLTNSGDFATTGHPAVRCALAAMYGELGELDAARATVDSLEIAALPRDNIWLVSMAELARAAASLGDRDRAAVIHGLLAPYARQNMVSGPPPHVFYGPVSHFLGVAAAAMGDPDRALQHFEHALSMARQSGAPVCVAQTQYEYGALLLAEGRDEARASDLLAEALRTARRCGLVPLEQRLGDLGIR